MGIVVIVGRPAFHGRDEEIKGLSFEFTSAPGAANVAVASAALGLVVDAMILFDRYTSYRVMTEVMFTLGQAKVSKFHFLAMSAKTGG
jgi:hypothetical protein